MEFKEYPSIKLFEFLSIILSVLFPNLSLQGPVSARLSILRTFVSSFISAYEIKYQVIFAGNDFWDNFGFFNFLVH